MKSKGERLGWTRNITPTKIDFAKQCPKKVEALLIPTNKYLIP